MRGAQVCPELWPAYERIINFPFLKIYRGLNVKSTYLLLG